MRRLLLPVIVAASLCCLSCGRPPRVYRVDKTSPGGTYRVKFDVRVEEDGDPFSGRFTEIGKIQYFEGEEVLYAHEWTWMDDWESTFIDNHPVVEWLDDDLLRKGRDRRGQPFLDEAVIRNNTGEPLKYLSVSYSRSETFMIFDVTPGGEITLPMSAEFISGHAPSTYLTYHGQTRGGREFSGSQEQKRSRSAADGPLKLQIAIN